MKKYILYTLIIFSFLACKKKNNTDIINNYYYLKIDNVALPINIIGNKYAEQAVIFINDGLTTNVNTEKNNIYWQYLEKNYKIVFYDQRGAGTAQGNAQPEDMSIEQFARDLDKVVDFTFEIAKVKSVFLHGLGIGGTVACQYLLDSTKQGKINGFIAEAPAYNLVDGLQLSKQKLLALADSNIANNINITYWQAQQAFYAANPTFNSNVFAKHINTLQQNNGIVYNITNIKLRVTDAPNTPVDAIYKNLLTSYNNIKYNNQYFTNINLTSSLNKIKIPILLAWGGQDAFLPKDNLAINFKLAIGNNVTYNPTKYIATGHVPHAEDFLNFQIDANAFINANK
jgi:pimeloyl-ACP methyl ester carboxylesterase